MRRSEQKSVLLSRRAHRFSLSPLLTLLLGFVIGLLVSWYWWQMLVEPVHTWGPVVTRVQRSYDEEVVEYRENFTVERFLNPAKVAPKVAKFIGYWDSEIGYLGRKSVLLGVMTSEQHLMTRAKTIFETWGRKADNIVFFVGSGCQIDRPELANMKFVRLPVPDDEYPPTRKLFAMIKYMTTHFIDQYHWFVRADDDVYIRYHRLLELLSKLDSSKELYVGHQYKPSMEHIFGSNPSDSYCVGGSGVLFSRVLLKALEPNLGLCEEAIDHYHFKSSTWYHEDAELGRCISKTLSIGCSQLEDDQRLFYHDYHENGNDITSLWHLGTYRQVLSIHPVKDASEMLRIHHFFAMVDFSDARKSKANEWKELNRVCGSLQELSISFIPPWIAVEICDGDITCGCEPEKLSLAGISYRFHLGQFGISNEDTWVRYFDQSEVLSGVVHYEVPSTCNHHHSQLHQLNVTDFLRYIEHFVPASSASLNVMGGLMHYGWLTGMQVFIHAAPKYPLPSKGVRRFDGYYSFQFITRLPPEIIVAQERMRYTSNKALHVVMVVEAGDPRINQFISDHFSILPKRKSAIKILFMVFVTKGKIRKVNTRRNPNIAVTYGRGQFSWEKGVEVALKRLADNSLVLVSDVDLNFKQELVDRCNQFSSSERVYFPVPVGCLSLDSNCIASESAHTYRLACGYVPSVRDWFQSVRDQSSFDNVYQTTALDSSLYVRNPSNSEFCS